MAPSKDIAPLLPETLPEDFSQWDGKAPAAPPPADSREREEWEAGDAFIETAKPLWQAADNDALLASLVDEPPDFGSTASSSIFVKQQEELINRASETAPAPKPAARAGWNEWEAAHSFGKPQKSAEKSADRETFLSPVVDKRQDSGSSTAAPAVVKQPEQTNKLGDDSPAAAAQKPEAQSETSEVPVPASSQNDAKADATSTASEPVVTTGRKADEAVFQLFSQKKIEVTLDLKAPKKKKMIVAGIGAGAILLPLLIMIPLLHHGTKSEAKHSVQPLPGESVTEVPASMPDAPASKPLPQGKPQAATEKPQTQTTDNQPSNQPSTQDEGTTPAQVQSTMMSDQLTAPTRIPKQTAENAPPPASDTAGAEGLGGNGPNASMFNGHSQPTVKVTRPVPISSGIATGMLIQSTPPVYPPLAKTAHVAGTVEVHATITTNGTIKDLRAVSGPAMLRQSAVDAVRTWRYQPYRLNNQPVEVETTINIVFTLGG